MPHQPQKRKLSDVSRVYYDCEIMSVLPLQSIPWFAVGLARQLSSSFSSAPIFQNCFLFFLVLCGV
jgi:hypothetical protein